MKVCLVSQEVAGVRGGGIGTYVVEAGKALRRAGHETWLVTRSGLGRSPAVPGFDHVVFADRGAEGRRLEFRNGEPHYEYSVQVHETLTNLGIELDYIEFPDYRAEGLVALQEQLCFGTYGRTVLGITLHTPSWEAWMADGQAHRADLRFHQLRLMEDEAIRIAPLLSSPSTSLAAVVADRLKLERQITIRRYPMELPSEIPEPPAPGRRIEDLSFLYFGRLEPRKGVSALVEAFRRLPSLSLTMIGGDTPLSSTGTSVRKNLERDLPQNVSIIDHVDRDRLVERLARFDVCIFPSLFENWPNVCLEAMAAGRLVIGSERSGMAEMIEDGVGGFLIDAGSADAIVDCLNGRLPRHLDRLDEIGTAAALRARELCEPRRFADSLAASIEEARTPDSTTPSIRDDGRVSVIIPLTPGCNPEPVLGSLVAQSHGDLEILLPASPDAGAERAHLGEAQTGDLQIRIVEASGYSIGSLRNAGLRSSTGEYVLFLEPTDELATEAIRLGVEALVRNSEAAFSVPRTSESGSSLVHNPLEYANEIALLGNRFGDSETLFRRSLFLDNDLEWDDVLPSQIGLALWMDLGRLQVHGVRMPRTLCTSDRKSNAAADSRSLAEHPAAMGLLIQRHWECGEVDRDALTALFASAGVAVAGTVGDRQVEIADTLAALARRAPRLTAILLRLARWLRAASGGVR